MVPKGYNGLTIFPFVFLKSKRFLKDLVIINHENIHLRQQLELIILPFYLIYSLEFIIQFIKHRNWHIAYRNISFEREAYTNEGDMNYLKKRPFWQFLKYY